MSDLLGYRVNYGVDVLVLHEELTCFTCTTEEITSYRANVLVLHEEFIRLARDIGWLNMLATGERAPNKCESMLCYMISCCFFSSCIMISIIFVFFVLCCSF